jgi:hypothetical protein
MYSNGKNARGVPRNEVASWKEWGALRAHHAAITVRSKNFHTDGRLDCMYNQESKSF